MTLNLDNVTSYRSMRKGNNWNMRLLYMFWGWHAAKNVLIIWWIILSIFKGVFLFGRIRKGVPSEAKVVARVLPPLLLDFFPAQEIMNKVIGEFLSSQQPHPELMAQVLFKVNTCRMLLHSDLFIHRFSSKSSIGPSLNSKLSDVINIKLFCAISISWSCGWWNKKGFPLDLKNKISRTKCLLSTIMRKFWIMTETLFWLYAADELLRSEGLLESFSFFNGPKIILVIKY